MSWTFENHKYLFLLLLIPILCFGLTSYIKWRKKKRNLFASPDFQKELFSTKNKYSSWLVVLYSLAFFFLVLAIVDVISRGEKVKVKHEGTNVIFLLDLSNSMNAEDIVPSRLEKEKELVVNTLEKIKGNKVGMVIFAGNAFSIMPLTTDYAAIETYISGLETSVMKHQGTDFLPAVQEAAALYQNTNESSRNVVLISDGEDNEGNDVSAADFADKYHMKLITVGIGTEEGAPVPEYVFGQMMGYKMTAFGDVVISKRETKALKKMAAATNGTYIDGNEDSSADKIASTLTNLKTDSEIDLTSQTANHYYQWFLAASLFLFFIIYLTNPKKDFNI